MKQAIYNNLPESDHSRIYLISSKISYREKYDFPQLRGDIAGSLPGLKQEVLLRTFKVESEDILKKKKQFLNLRLCFYSLSSGVVGAIPVPGVDIAYDMTVFLNMIAEQRTQLSITEQDLEEAYKDLGFYSSEDLIKNLDKGRIMDRLTPMT